MKSVNVIWIISILILTNISAQQPAAHFEGKIVLEDDLSAPIEGAIRFNSTTKQFEGFDGQQWKILSANTPENGCTCPYVLTPFTDQVVNGDFENGKLKFTIEFSHKMLQSSFVYGINIIISGTQGTSGSGTLTWSNNRTKLIIVTSESWSSIGDCGSVFSLTLKGTGMNAILGANNQIFDGDRDGCCGEDYIILYRILC